MATKLKDLFNSKNKDLYGKSRIFINSKGIINPPRLKALALSSPNAALEFASIAGAAALGLPIGTANRPSDTIFLSPKPFEKPVISLAGLLGQRLIRPNKSYYIKRTPAPYELVNQIKTGISTNPLGTLLTVAKSELQDGTLKDIFRKLSRNNSKYGAKYQHNGINAKPLMEDLKFSEKSPNYSKPGGGLNALVNSIINPPKPGSVDLSYSDRLQTSLSEDRVESKVLNGVSKWDQINNNLLEGVYKEYTDLQTANEKVNIPYVAFEVYGKTGEDAHILLPGTISSLSEDVTPNWNTSKYVGSPFNTYRYGGVERSIKFDLKLYSNGPQSLKTLRNNLDKLRKTCFPDEEITQIQFGLSTTITNGFNPNLLYLTISGYYKKLFGFVDGLNVSVEDGVPWPTTSTDFDGVRDAPHPAVISVSISMKIIEAVDIKDKKFVYNMTGILDAKVPTLKPPKFKFI